MVRHSPPLFILFPVCLQPSTSGKRAGGKSVRVDSSSQRLEGQDPHFWAIHWGSPGGSEATQDSGFCSRPSSGSQLGCWLRNLCSEAVSWHGIPRTCQSTKERGHLRGVSSESRSKRGRGRSRWLGRWEGWAGAEDLWTRAAEALVPVGRGA